MRLGWHWLSKPVVSSNSGDMNPVSDVRLTLLGITCELRRPNTDGV